MVKAGRKPVFKSTFPGRHSNSLPIQPRRALRPPPFVRGGGRRRWNGTPTKDPAVVAAGGGDPQAPSNKDKETNEGNDEENNLLRRLVEVWRKGQEDERPRTARRAGKQPAGGPPQPPPNTPPPPLSSLRFGGMNGRQAWRVVGHRHVGPRVVVQNIAVPSTALEKFYNGPKQNVMDWIMRVEENFITKWDAPGRSLLTSHGLMRCSQLVSEKRPWTKMGA